MNLSPELQKRVRRRIFLVRCLGGFFAVTACLFIVGGICMLYDPKAAVTVNGVQRTDTSAKLPFVLVPLPHLVIGLFLMLVPQSWLTKYVIASIHFQRRLLTGWTGPLKKE